MCFSVSFTFDQSCDGLTDNKNSTHTHTYFKCTKIGRKKNELDRMRKCNCTANNGNNQSPIDDDFKFKHNKLRLFLFDCLIMIIGELTQRNSSFVHRYSCIGFSSQNQCGGGGDKCRHLSIQKQQQNIAIA